MKQRLLKQIGDMPTWSGIILVDESDINKENIITTSTIPDMYGIMTYGRKYYIEGVALVYMNGGIANK